jgi:chromate transport protein ChrA
MDVYSSARIFQDIILGFKNVLKGINESKRCYLSSSLVPFVFQKFYVLLIIFLAVLFGWYYYCYFVDKKLSFRKIKSLA